MVSELRLTSTVEYTVPAIRPGRFDIDMTTDALPILDLLKNEIEKNGNLRMSMQSTRRQKDQVRSTIRVELVE